MEADIALGDVKMTLNQRQNGALAGAGRPANPQHLPGLERKVDLFQRGLVRLRVDKLAHGDAKRTAPFRRRVNQTPFLFSDTVASNIALGKPDATQEQIEHVARLASVHEDILRLPQGYNTEVGERGVMLSGGQKQRISIARALLLEAEILILDDALSAVDGRTEHQILHNLRQWGEGRTVIISAHRLSALTEASEILVMQHGHISQRGRHEALAAQPGWYRDMYRYQQLEAALDDVPQEDKEVAGA